MFLPKKKRFNMLTGCFFSSGTSRHVVVSQKIVERLKRHLDDTEDFTFLAAVKQLEKTSGSIIAFTGHRKR